ncbi:MAG: S28 family serine protease [Bacteroidales bacterium]
MNRKHVHGVPLFFSTILLILILLPSCQKKKGIARYIENLPQSNVNNIQIELEIQQPVDHKKPAGPKFTQQVVLNHVGYDRPVVVYIEGYQIYSKKRGELAKLLDANQITIEHRYFDDSKPDSLNWEYLNIWQAATDHHKVIQAFKDLYQGNWVSTGISKGGQATIYHRRFYPKDVDVSVPYVAPLNFSDEDKRVYAFLDSVGTEACRKKIKTFQKQLFEHKDQLLPKFKEFAQKKDYQFPMGIERAYDLNVLEYSFAFWQWGDFTCKNIPDNEATPQVLFDHWTQVTSGSFFERDEIENHRAFFYQAMTQIGMYGYDTEPFKKYLPDTTNITFEFTLPEGVDASFDTSIMKDVNQWLKNSGNHMLYIYGENDPWSATSFTPSKQTNAVKMVNPEGSHKTRIKSFPTEMKDSIYTLLEKWLDIKINSQQNTNN